MKKILIILIYIFSHSLFAEVKIPDYARINIKNWAFNCENIVDICIYKKDWSPPNNNFSKGHSKFYGVVIGVHKGTLKVGDKITYNRYFEFGKDEINEVVRERPEETQIVDGELASMMFANSDFKKSEGIYQLIGDAGIVFHFGDDFHKALLARKKVDPHLTGSLDDE